MTLFLINPHTTRSLRAHPGWRTGDTPETARVLTADELVEAGWGPKVIDQPPPYDPALQSIAVAPIEDWPTDATTATKLYIVTDYTLEELKARRKAAVGAILAAKLAGGYSHDFGAPHGVQVLQTRDADDRINWLTSQAAYSAAVMGGAGAVMGANLRAEDNADINMSYADGLNVLLAMAAWGAACYANSWALKNAIEAAADATELEAIDIETGWPV